MEILRSFSFDTTIERGDKDRTRKFTISTGRLDAHNTILPVDGWDIEDFNRIGAFYYMHNTGGSWINESDPDNALGPARAMIVKDKLIGIGEFEPADINEKAEKILKKVDFGTMKTTSVGFAPDRKDPGHWGEERNGEDPTIYYFGKRYLKEFSIVHIPSNADAVINKNFESYSKFMSKQIEAHKSEGFRKDYNLLLRRLRWQMEF